MVIPPIPPPPSFGPTPNGTFEADIASPYLGTTLDGKYAPTATDVLQGDISASIVTYLGATGQQIALSGPSSYLFPLGETTITNVVRDAYGRVFDQNVTIAVADRTPPSLAVAGPGEVVLTGPRAVNYTGKVGTGHPCWGLGQALYEACSVVGGGGAHRCRGASVKCTVLCCCAVPLLCCAALRDSAWPLLCRRLASRVPRREGWSRPALVHPNPPFACAPTAPLANSARPPTWRPSTSPTTRPRGVLSGLRPSWPPQPQR